MQAIILGFIQGVTEFLPISSSAHLLLVPYLLGWTPYGLSFDVALHFGTLLAVLIYFFPVWRDLVIKGLLRREPKEFKLLLLLIVATIPAAVIGLVAQHTVEAHVRQPALIAVMLILFGIILYLADRYGRHQRSIDNLTWKDSLGIGLAQALALIPGVSRSGITMTTALSLGMARDEAARFSFLLLAPITLGAVITQVGDIGKLAPSAVVWGTLTSFVVGLISIHFLLQFIKKYGFAPYMWYRLAFGLFVLAVVLLRR